MSVIAGPDIIRDNSMVLCLDASNIKSYPGTGTTWFDLSEKKYNGTFSGGISFVSGSMVLAGADAISIGLATQYMPFPNHSMEVWFKTSRHGAGMTIGGLFGITYGTLLFVHTNGNLRYSNYNTDTEPFGSDFLIDTTGINVLDDKWHHVAATRSSGSARLYLDGRLVNSAVPSVPNWSGTNVWSGMTAVIGNNPNDAYYKFKGRISSARIYKRELSSDEVYRSYSTLRTKFSNDPIMITESLQSFWDAGAQSSYVGTGTSWSSIGPVANTATLTNGPILDNDGGGSFVFDGSDYALLSSSISLTATTNWTVNILAKGTAFPGDGFGNMFSNISGGPVSNAMGIANTKMVYNTYNGTWQYRYANSTLSTNTWYYLTWVNSSNSTLKMYVNGILDSDDVASANGGPCNSIGRNWYSTFNGKIASVSYYNVAHTPSQVMQNFKWARERVGM